jgi:hypothetical protein
MRWAFLLAVGLLLAACSDEAVVPPAEVETSPTMTPIPGNYAAAVVAGRWKLEASSDQIACSTWTVQADVDPSFRKTMQTALTRSLQRVTFVPEPLTPDQLEAQGFAAQIVIGQRKAESTFDVESTLLRGEVRSDVSLSALVAVQGADTTVHQQEVSARGHGVSETSYCSTISEATSAAAQDALSSIARQVVLYVQGDLNARRLAKLDAAGSSSRIETETLPPGAAPPVSLQYGAPAQSAPAQDAPTYMLPRELLEPRPPAAAPEPSKEDELRRDLQREGGRGNANPGDSSMNGAADRPATDGEQTSTEGAAAPSNANSPAAGSKAAGVTVAPIPPGASVNSGPPGSGAAAADDPDGKRAFQRGTDAAAGRGVAQSDADAVRWFRAAADRGYAPAENNLGFLYAEGRGVPRDDAEAVRWYRRAADRDYAPAETSLGMMYAQGRGVAQSDSEALTLYSAAANQGYPQAKANLAEMYASGRGVARDERTASFLLRSVRATPLSGSGVYVEAAEPPPSTPAAAPGQ